MADNFRHWEARSGTNSVSNMFSTEHKFHAELNANKYLMVNYFQFLDYNSLFVKIQMITCSYWFQ